MKFKRRVFNILLVAVWVLLLSPLPVQTNAGLPGEALAQNAFDQSSNTSSALTICMGQEPDTLYIYDSYMLAQSAVLEAIYDGPIDNRSFDYQAVILEKLPSLADGNVLVQPVTVQQWDTVLDADLKVVILEPGVQVIPSGGIDPVTYSGGQIDLDQVIVTFTLKSDLTWSDGTPLTAADSVYSFNLSVHPDTPTDPFMGERTYSYTALDDHSTVWVGLPGYKDADFADNFWTPLPEHVWAQYTAAKLLTAEISARKPLGWGPYVIDEWIAGDRITLHKNPNYFRAGEGLPRFDNLVFKFVGENSSANIAALLTGECDIVDQTGHLDDQFELLIELEEQGKVNVASTTGDIWEHADFGIQHVSYDDGYDGGISDRPDFFSDRRVRRAFAYCMDREKIIDTVLFGKSLVIDTYMHPEHPLYNPNVISYPFDPSSGRNLLAQAGWVDQDGDGVREAHGVGGVPDGTRLEVSYGTTTAAQRQQATQVLAQSMAECGIKVNLNYYAASEWFADGPEGLLFGRQFDLGQFAWLTGVIPPCDLYLSDNITGPSGGTWLPIMDPGAGLQTFSSNWDGINETGYYNPSYDQVCKSAMNSLPGESAYTTNHLEAQRIFAYDLPVIPLYLRLKLAAARPDVVGFNMDPTADSEFWNIEAFGRYTISGRVQESSGEPVTAATIQVGQSDTLTLDASGYYNFTTVLAGTYTLTPELTDMSGYSIFPPDRTITLPPGAADMDFVVAQDYDTVLPSGSEGIVFGDPTESQVTIEVPAGAVTGETTLLYTPTDAVYEVGFAGFAFGLSAYQNGEPVEDFTFEEPVTVRVDYDEADVAGRDENNLRLLSWTGTTWEDAACGAYERHPGENWLSVPVCHLSKFGLFDRQELFLPVVLRFVF